MALYPIILCGGSGTRLWPLSRSLLPKQFIALSGSRTMLQNTALRLHGLDAAPPLVLSNTEHRFLVAEQLREIGVPVTGHILEPVGRNTAPAIAAAAMHLAARDEESLLLVLPSDHLITNVSAFHEAVVKACRLAGSGKLVTFGITPTEPATGYGYIRRGKDETGIPGTFGAAQFVEKPDLARARHFVESGDYYWNSGMFLFAAHSFLHELGRFRPDILSAVSEAIAKSTTDVDFVRLDEAVFSRCPAESIDYAVMEQTQDACVVPASLGWSDVGSWSALWEVEPRDRQGNTVRGDVYLDQTTNSYVRAEERLVAAIGVRDLIIVETADAVLVADKAHSERVKQLVERLKSDHRPEHMSSRRVYRPWGYYESIDSGSAYQVKRLMLKRGARISLQLHRRRAEHWVVVSGEARVTRDKELLTLGPNQSTYIPIGTKHRLENLGTEPLYVIEVQSGDYLGEDDIERFDDDYRRA